MLSAIHQCVAVNLWSEGGFRQGRSPSATLFLPALDPHLGISTRNHYKNGSIPSKALKLSLTPSCPALDPPRVDLIKSLNTCAGHENFIPTKFNKHPSSGFVVKADYVCSHVLVHPPPPSPK